MKANSIIAAKAKASILTAKLAAAKQKKANSVALTKERSAKKVLAAKIKANKAKAAVALAA